MPSSFLDVLLGNRSVEGVEDSGFYHDEENDSGPFRWTDGRAKLVVPLKGPDRPQRLWVQLHRPKNTWVRIVVNNRELVNEGLFEGELLWWESTQDLSGVPLGESVVVEVISNPVLAPDGDSRRLGVRVRGIKLLRDDGQTPPSFLDAPLGGRFVAGVEEGGFWNQEKDGGQPCRWTNGSARLSVPLHGQRPQALSLTAFIPNEPDYRLRVTVNGTKLFDGPVVSRKWWSGQWPLAGVDLGDRARIELTSSTVVPALVDLNSRDDRRLGIRLKRLMLLADPTPAKK
jgi:hypothetical protein